MSVITPARGMKELGGTTTLGNPRTYSVVTSRSFTITGKEPWTMKDRLYPWQQQSTASYYDFKAMNTWFKTYKSSSRAQAVKEEGYVYLAGSHTQRDTEIILQVWELEKDHTMDRKYTRKFTGETNKVNVMGVAKVETNESAYNVYVFYTIPKEENRYKVLNVMVDSDTIEPYTYYFEQPKSYNGKPITGVPEHFYYDTNDWFVFGGSTTFLEGDAKKRVFLDWTG